MQNYILHSNKHNRHYTNITLGEDTALIYKYTDNNPEYATHVPNSKNLNFTWDLKV